MEHQLEVFISKSCHVVIAMPQTSTVFNHIEDTICVGFQPKQARALAQTLITQADNAENMEREVE